MVLDEFDKSTAKNFYIGINSIFGKDIDEYFSDYYDSLNNFNKENQVFLKENPNFIGITNNYYNELISIKEDILIGLNYSINIVDLISIILHISPEKSLSLDLFSLMNCKFMERDSKVFYLMMGKLKNNSFYILILCIPLIVFKLLSAVLITFNIYKFKKEEEDQSNRETSNSQNLLN